MWFDLILNSDGVDDEPSQLIHREAFEKALFQLNGPIERIEKREPDRYFFLNPRLGAAIEIDTDEGEDFGSIYISVSDQNPNQANRTALGIAKHLAKELNLKIINPAEGIEYPLDSIRSLK